MMLILFRCRLREGVDTEMERVGARMYELASQMPGFISYRDYAAADGEVVTAIEFESAETLKAWREHPEHREAQLRGQQEFFSQYRIQVCTVDRDYAFP